MAIIQNNPKRCELIGCSTQIVKYVFPLNILYHHIEHEYKKRIHLLSENKILKLPIMDIEKTIMGNGAYLSSL